MVSNAAETDINDVMVGFLTPLSTPEIYVRSSPALKANSSWERPKIFLRFFISWPRIFFVTSFFVCICINYQNETNESTDYESHMAFKLAVISTKNNSDTAYLPHIHINTIKGVGP